MSDLSLREMVELTRDALMAREEVTDMHTGPRSNELWFHHRDGREIRVAIQVFEKHP
ncbi:hypothetical protein HRJ34_14665 [Rhizorhabdus wittichii]|uniref:Uncharacterized protein n=1 Tax=Rhizorhabdus wittichii TaxID=160791 RepID=A0A975HBY8_9SPHN|nr:hypothetical protein [Rhizorhabdus wittichii]QTH19617.1 hypothetical protein HRJ34_14665 [Rhizorhabdus wittichii]